MSGIEVAGLVLGVIPILIEAVDICKVGIERSKIAFRKRKYVEKLAHALLLQEQILRETIKSVLIESGCEDVWRLNDDPHVFLDDEHIQEQILDFLGPANNAAFNGAFEQSNSLIKEIVKGVAGLVPSFKVDIYLTLYSQKY